MAVFHTHLVNLKIDPRNLRHNECFAVIIAIGFTHSILDLLTTIIKSSKPHSTVCFMAFWCFNKHRFVSKWENEFPAVKDEIIFTFNGLGK